MRCFTFESQHENNKERQARLPGLVGFCIGEAVAEDHADRPCLPSTSISTLSSIAKGALACERESAG